MCIYRLLTSLSEVRPQLSRTLLANWMEQSIQVGENVRRWTTDALHQIHSHATISLCEGKDLHETEPDVTIWPLYFLAINAKYDYSDH